MLLDPEKFLAEIEASLSLRHKPEKNEEIRLGLDLGTASIVLSALGAGFRPLGTVRRFVSVVKDGLVVDYDGARAIVRELRAELEEALSCELTETAIAVPPGTSERDTATHGYVAQGAGLEVTRVIDEPTAANLVLGLSDGVIADIGGGTTGVAVISGGEVKKTFDEPTGGTHLTLVIAGHFKMSFEEAELYKTDPKNAALIGGLVAPVLQKIGTIIRLGTKDCPGSKVYLVGGTAATYGIAGVVSRELGHCPVTVSFCPALVTPAGIALAASPMRVAP